MHSLNCFHFIAVIGALKKNVNRNGNRDPCHVLAIDAFSITQSIRGPSPVLTKALKAVSIIQSIRDPNAVLTQILDSSDQGPYNGPYFTVDRYSGSALPPP